MGCNWLKGPREAAGFTQEALAVGLGGNVKTIQRLERCGADTPRQVPYADLATAIRVCPAQLAEDHARDLTANDQPAHAQRARVAADRLRRARHFPTIDPAPIRGALVACRASGLSAHIALRLPDLPDEQAQAAHIARLLHEGDLDQLTYMLNQPLGATIGQAPDATALENLAGFLRIIVRTCAAQDPALTAAARPGVGGWHQHQGETHAWPYTAMIDQSCGLDGLRHLQPLAGTSEPRLDEGSIRAVRAGPVTQTDIPRRLWALVGAFADLVAFDGDKPLPAETAAFADYCSRVNRMLWGLNYEDEHVFGLWDQAHCEPDEVKQRLLQCLPDLRLFDCGEPGRASSVLRVDGGKLETWLAARLKAIAARQRTLATTPPPKQPTPQPEPTPMNEASTVVIINAGSGNNVNTATGHAQAHQHNLTAAPTDLLPWLQQLLDQTGAGEPRHTDLRRACRVAQGELEETGALSAPTKTWLQRAIETVPTADRVFGIVQKVAELLARVPGLGA